MEKQTLSFQAEVKQILHLVTHSLYSNKEIFLRELVSNASDACDKLRFEAIDHPQYLEDAPNLELRIFFDAEKKTLTIRDNGIGLSAEEAVSHLGTIAKSGTKEFMSKLEGDQKKDASLIGQFGVGFYSGFIVADRMTVESRRAGLPAGQGVRWSSEGTGDFEVEEITRAERGTDVILHLRDGEDEFLRPWKLKSIISKYSDHISLPILMKKEEWNGETAEYKTLDEWETRQQGLRAVGALQERRHRRRIHRFLQADLVRFGRPAGVHAQPRRRPQRVHAAALHPGARADRHVEPRQARRRQAVRQAHLHHGRRRGVDAGVPALRQGRDRLGRPAAERVARAAAGKPRREGHPRGLHQARAVDAGVAGPTATTWARRTSTRRSGTSSARC